MGNDSLEELLEDTIHVINIHNTKCPTKFQNNKFKVEQFVSGGEPSPAFIKVVCSFVEDNLNDENCGNYKKGDAKSCYDMYLKNSNPMGFLIMLSKLLPALECPHTILTTGPVKKRLVTKKAKLLLLNFLTSVTLLCEEIFEDLGLVRSDNSEDEDDANAKEPDYCCYYCGDCDVDGMENHAAMIAHISGLAHMEKVVKKLEKENNLKRLQNFGYFVNRTQTSTTTTKNKKKMNQLREGIRKMSTNEKEKLGETSSSNRKAASPDVMTEAQNPHGGASLDKDVDRKTKDFETNKMEDGPGHVTKRSQECGSTPPVTSSGHEEAAATDGATGGMDQGGSRRRICWNCHAQGTLLKCSGCMRAWYCGQRCKEADWDRHGGYCEARQRKKRLAEVD